MGKLHGLCIGLDVCSTLHMDVSLSDLDWCLEQIMPANPAYLMALPTKIDPMLGYLTTGYQDHVRLREQFGYRVNDVMWNFFQRLGVIDTTGQPTQHFGDPTWVYAQYQRAKGDDRKIEILQQEGRHLMEQVRSRGVFLASGYGTKPSELAPQLKSDIERIYTDSKKAIWAELSPEFIATIPHALTITTRSHDRSDYILHPSTGEQLSMSSINTLRQLRVAQLGAYDLQIVISDGLNALAIEAPDQLLPFLTELRSKLKMTNYRVAPENLVVRAGRVRAGYQIGEVLYGGTTGMGTIVHIIGERPGTGHQTFSVYFTTADARTWNEPKKVDHDITRVVSGIATTALSPAEAAKSVVEQLSKR
jgi:ethanolamine ammonia-lyase large subunit